MEESPIRGQPTRPHLRNVNRCEFEFEIVSLNRVNERIEFRTLLKARRQEGRRGEYISGGKSTSIFSRQRLSSPIMISLIREWLGKKS